jgi:hypothetical protein
MEDYLDDVIDHSKNRSGKTLQQQEFNQLAGDKKKKKVDRKLKAQDGSRASHLDAPYLNVGLYQDKLRGEELDECLVGDQLYQF